MPPGNTCPRCESDRARIRNAQQKVGEIVARGRAREGEAAAGVLLCQQVELLPAENRRQKLMLCGRRTQSPVNVTRWSGCA